MISSLQSLLNRLPLQRFILARYLVSGGTAASVDFSLLYILTEFFHVWYLLSSIVAVAVAIMVSFLLQKFWTFQSNTLDTVHIQLSLHSMLSFLNLGLNTFLLYFFVEYVHLWYIFAQFLGAGLLACMNYFVYRTWIFSGNVH